MSPAGPVERSGPQAEQSRTLILNSAELGCITTRATDTALPHSQSYLSASHSCSLLFILSSFLFFFSAEVYSSFDFFFP